MKQQTRAAKLDCKRELDVVLKNESIKIGVIAEGSQIVIVLRADPERGLKIQSTRKRLHREVD